MTDFFVAAQAIRYDGTNGAAVCNFVQTVNTQLGTFLGWTMPTCVEDPITHTIAISNPIGGIISGGLTVAQGQWLVFEGSQLAVFDNPVFQALHRKHQPNLTAVAAVPVPGIAALSSAQVEVNLPFAFSGTGAYTAQAYLVGATAGIAIGAVQKFDADTVRVRVDAALAFTGSAQVLVVATGDPA